jgi:hypothetical protein
MAVHVYRWDLDRTYLDTEIHSVRGLVRAALETASEKRTVPGAAALIRGLQLHDPLARVSVLSGSPTQMRAVLTQKLELDGVRVDSLTLKDNLGNLKRGRLRAVRGQIGFKLPHLLEERLMELPETEETLFGDDSEADALIYSAYATLLAGKLELGNLLDILRAGEAYPDAIERAEKAARQLLRLREDVVKDIFIRIDRGVPVWAFRMLGSKVIPVFSWFQAALVLMQRGRLPARAVAEVGEASCEAQVRPHSLPAWLVDAVRRGLVDRELVESLLSTDPFEPYRAIARRDLDRLGPISPPPAGQDLVAQPDFLGFLQAVRR